MLKDIAILHEGRANNTNDNALLTSLIKNIGLDIERVEFFGFGAKSNFFTVESQRYKALRLKIEEEEVAKVLFVVDADYEKNDAKYGGYKNTKASLIKVMSDLNLENYADSYIVCDPESQCGYLESFILSTIPDTHKKCIENFLNCSDFKSKENHKSILNQIYKIAYPETPFDFSHKNFDELKQKLRKLFGKEA